MDLKRREDLKDALIDKFKALRLAVCLLSSLLRELWVA